MAYPLALGREMSFDAAIPRLPLVRLAPSAHDGWMTRSKFSGHALSAAAAVLLLARVAPAQEACFERLDNGVDMSGWVKSTTNPHGPGDGWTVEDGAFVGRQTDGQQGGILMTEQSYQDVEVILEVRVDWGCDSGLFFRTTEGARAYQVTIDHIDDSAVGTIWGESFSQELRAIPYWLTDGGSTAIVAPDGSGQPMFDLSLWPTIWDPTDFNEIRARIEGNPPNIQVWISGTQVTDFTDSMLRSEVNESGPLAIQVHNGGRWTADGSVAFRNIRARDLSVPCEDPVEGEGGAGGEGGESTGGESGGGSGGGGGREQGLGGDGPDTGGTPGTAEPPQAGGAGGNVGNPGVGGSSDASGGTPASAAGAPGAVTTPQTDSGDTGGCALGPNKTTTQWRWLLSLVVALLLPAVRRGGHARAFNAHPPRPT